MQTQALSESQFSTCCLFKFFKYLQIWIFTEIHCGFYYVSTVICAFVQTFFRVEICLKICLNGFNFFPFFLISHVTNSAVAKIVITVQKEEKRLWPLCCFSPSLFRTLGLPCSPSCAPCRVWKPPREQLHRAPECAGSPPIWALTTRHSTIRSWKPAWSKSSGSFPCVTATSKSSNPQNTSSH